MEIGQPRRAAWTGPVATSADALERLIAEPEVDAVVALAPSPKEAELMWGLLEAHDKVDATFVFNYANSVEWAQEVGQQLGAVPEEVNVPGLRLPQFGTHRRAPMRGTIGLTRLVGHRFHTCFGLLMCRAPPTSSEPSRWWKRSVPRWWQEPDFCPRQQGQVRGRLNSAGYASWTVEASNAGGRHRGGLVVAVKSGIRTHVLHQLACPGGYLITLSFEHCVGCFLWRRADMQDSEEDECLQRVEEQRVRAGELPFFVVGDFNLERGSWTCMKRVNSPCMLPLTVRASGRRSIDFLVARPVLRFSQPALREEVLGDHRVFQVLWDLGFPVNTRPACRRTCMYRQPPEASLAEWRAAVEMHWPSDGVGQGTTEEEWEVFNARAEHAMTRAHEQLAPCPRPPAARPKGTMPVSVRRFDSSSRPGLQRFSQRHMAKFLGRVREVRRQLAQGRNPVSLRQALARRWPAHIARKLPRSVLIRASNKRLPIG